MWYVQKVHRNGYQLITVQKPLALTLQAEISDLKKIFDEFYKIYQFLDIFSWNFTKKPKETLIEFEINYNNNLSVYSGF